jgi:hypothetical protein
MSGSSESPLWLGGAGVTATDDGADFNDPDAWGYCAPCAFTVAKFLDSDLLYPHTRSQTGTSMEQRTCDGSGLPAWVQPGLEAKPRPLAALGITMERAADALREAVRNMGAMEVPDVSEDEGD